jgi:hypothetical protein
VRLGAGRGAHTDPVALLRRLRAGSPAGRLIAERMREVAQDGEVDRVAARLVVTQETPRLLARAAAQALAGSGDFTALHLVHLHARDARAHPLRRRAAARLAALLAGLCPCGGGCRPAARAPAPLLGWDALVRAALASNNEHLIKIVDSCREEERAWAEPGQTLRAAASQFLARSAA